LLVERIRLYASVAVLTLPPPIVARMAATIDSIAPGRFEFKGEFFRMNDCRRASAVPHPGAPGGVARYSMA